MVDILDVSISGPLFALGHALLYATLEKVLQVYIWNPVKPTTMPISRSRDFAHVQDITSPVKERELRSRSRQIRRFLLEYTKRSMERTSRYLQEIAVTALRPGIR